MKQFIVNGLVSLGVLAFLIACGTEVKTREYYEQHIDEARAKREECRKQRKPDKDWERDCENAEKAVLMRRSKDNEAYKQYPDAFKW